MRESFSYPKNNLAAIIGLLYLEERYHPAGDRTPYATLVRDLTGRIQSLAVVHDLLSAGAWGPLPLTDLAEKVLNALLALRPPRHPAQVEVQPSLVQLTSKQARALGMILGELATNALKYAARDDAPLRLSLRISLAGNEASLAFCDNGRGFPGEVLAGERHSVGLHLVKALAEQDLGGSTALRNDAGAVVEVRFALSGGGA